MLDKLKESDGDKVIKEKEIDKLVLSKFMRMKKGDITEAEIWGEDEELDGLSNEIDLEELGLKSDMIEPDNL